MAEEMVLDAAVETEPIETAVESADDGTQSGADASIENSESGIQAAEVDVPVGQVWKEAKELLKDKPGLYRAIKTALHTQERLKETLPDGIESAVKRLEAVNQLDDDPEDPEYMPGSRTFEEVISNTLAERGFWRDFDTAFQAGDRRVIAQMSEAHPMSFQKLIPEAMDHYQQLNPDGYSSYICKSVDSYLTEQKIPLQMEILNMLLPQSSQDPGTQRVIDAFGAIKNTISNIQAAAQRPIAPRKVEGTSEPTIPTKSNDSELDARHNAWLPAIKVRSEELAVSEALKLAGKTRFTLAEARKIKDFVRAEVNVRTKANDAYQKRVKGLLKANNKASYEMTVESEHKKIIQEAVKRIVPQVLSERAKPGPKPGQKQEQKPVVASNKPGDEQYELIAGPPRTLSMKVDFSRTPHSMMAQDRAYIVGRVKPVRWRRK